jgi:hypothetical protein
MELIVKSTVEVADNPTQLAEVTCPDRTEHVADEIGRLWLVDTSCDHCMDEN